MDSKYWLQHDGIRVALAQDVPGTGLERIGARSHDRRARYLGSALAGRVGRVILARATATTVRRSDMPDLTEHRWWWWPVRG